MGVWARPIREGVGNYGPWIKARVTPVLVIEMSRKSLGGWRAKYYRGWQKDVSAQGDGEPHVLGTAVATFCQKMGQSGKRTTDTPYKPPEPPGWSGRPGGAISGWWFRRHFFNTDIDVEFEGKDRC